MNAPATIPEIPDEGCEVTLAHCRACGCVILGRCLTGGCQFRDGAGADSPNGLCGPGLISPFHSSLTSDEGAHNHGDE